MKKIKLFAIAAVALSAAITGTSCSRSDKLDVEGIKEVTNKGEEELKSADIDFILDQMEILVDKTKGMTKEEAEAYYKTLDEDEQECVMALGMIAVFAPSSTSDKSDSWTDAQIERLKSLKEHMIMK